MSKAVRKQLFTILETLQKANELLPKLGKARKYEDTLQLLADCQESAIAIGTQIETVYSKDLSCIHTLEDYCETLYQIAEQLEQQENSRMLYQQSSDLLKEIENRMKQELPDKLEVVFLPYKVSMWDSLESIWFAARDDKDCDDYVIPIPYYDKNPDGSLGTLYYEGDKYPSYVPITGYEDYDFAVRCPDIIFIHNPYDECNYVTSVHPFFYSRNLKRFTDKLVYVPYYVMNGQVVSETQVIVPGVINADYVVVQNVFEQDVYIQSLHQQLPQVSEDLLREKILPLGSPKYDKINSITDIGEVVSKEWLEKSEGKKVILYNTTISAMLSDTDKYLRKMEEIFSIFQKREDVILLWRPHPLIEDTLKAMRNSCVYRNYTMLKKIFLKDKVGIYDDTSDMYAAIAYSDGYYGDGSSMLWIYQQTGKPVMLQNLEVQNYREIKLSVIDMVCDENTVFILAGNVFSLFSYSLKSNKMKFLTSIGENFQALYGVIHKHNNKIIVCPSYHAKFIIIFDLEKNNTQYIEIPVGIKDEHNIYLNEVACFNNKLYLWGLSKSHLFCFDMENYDFSNKLLFQTTYYKNYGVNLEISYDTNICIVDNTFWIPFINHNIIMQYNMENDDFCFHYIGEQEIQYNTICYDGLNFWLTGNKEFIVKWDIENDETNIYNNFPDKFKVINRKADTTMLFERCLNIGDKVYLTPENCNMVLSVDIKTADISSLECITKYDVNYTMKSFGNNTFYLEEVIDGLSIIQRSFKLDSHMKSTPFYFSFKFQDDACNIYNSICCNKNICESHKDSIEMFIKALNVINIKPVVQNHLDYVGPDIYKYIKNKIC